MDCAKRRKVWNEVFIMGRKYFRLTRGPRKVLVSAVSDIRDRFGGFTASEISEDEAIKRAERALMSGSDVKSVGNLRYIVEK